MSPRLNPWEKSEPTPSVNKAQEASVKEESKPVPPQEEETKPTVILTELDSQIREMIRSQPRSLDDLRAEIAPVEAPGLHRLSLPEYFEEFSYDCTRGSTCRTHKKDEKGKVLNPGKYVMRWLLKDKRAIDFARNVRGWAITNRVLFPEAPRVLFGASGAVEVGDAVLAVLDVGRALHMRELPGQKSRERINAMLVPGKNPKRVRMGGNLSPDATYEPEMGAEEGEGEAALPPGAIQVD